MSGVQLPKTNKTKIYDSNGKTAIPAEVRKDMGLEEGDTVVFVQADGETKIYNEDDIEWMG